MMYKMKFQRQLSMITIMIILFILVGCNKKTDKPMDLTKFLPSESNATQYMYKLSSINENSHNGKTKSKNIYTEKIITGKKNNCVYMDLYTLFDDEDISLMPDSMKLQIKDNKLKNWSTQLCANSEKIFYHDGSTLYQHNKDWTVEIKQSLSSGEEKTIQAPCHLISRSKNTILGKEREVIHTRCEYEIEHEIHEKTDWFLAEGLGLYKTVTTMDDKHQSNCKSHSHSHGPSTLTTLLIRYK